MKIPPMIFVWMGDHMLPTMRRIALDYDRIAKLAEEQLADQEKRATGD